MLSSDKNIETIAQLIEAVKSYLGHQAEYLKLDMVDKVVRVLTGAALLLLLFIILIVVDIFTRCMAMSALLWHNMYGEEIVKKRGNLLNYIKWTWQAHKWRYIDSSALRDGFWRKVITYFILLVVATCGDQILRVSHIPPFVLLVFCGILTCTEIHLL